MDNIIIRGMSWSHKRGIAPVEKTADIYSKNNPAVTFQWDARSLQGFESQPIRELAEQYDLMVIDHPHLGEAIAEGLLLDFTKVVPAETLSTLAQQSVGLSHQSYCITGGQFALAIDAAAPVACYRPDLLTHIPKNWKDVLDMARDGSVAIPLRSPHALMLFFWVANALKIPLLTSPDTFMADDNIATVLNHMRDLTDHISSDCYDSDPIAVLDAMAHNDTTTLYCPHIYGYINYSWTGFRDNVVVFDNIVPLNTGEKIGGTVLGGTGIAVSALSNHRDIAVQYALEIASAPCQSDIWVRSGGQPGNKVAWQDENSNRLTHNFMHNTLTTLENAWLRPRYNGYLTFQSRGSDLVCDFLRGATDQTTTIHALQTLYNQSIL